MRRCLSTLFVTFALAGTAQAAPAVDGVFDLPGVQTNGQLTTGPDGNIWVALEQGVARVQPSGTVDIFTSTELPALGSPTGGITSAAGFIWVSQTPGAKDPIVKIQPGNPPTAAGVPGTGINAGATAMTAGSDGNIWVGLAGRLISFSPSNPAGATPHPITGLSPKAMAASSDGTLWVTDTQNGGRLINVTTAGDATPYTVGGQPQFVAGGPNGQIAFGNPNSTPQQIGLLSPGGSPLTIDRPNGSDPFGVTFGTDGAFWVAEFAGNRLARVTTDGQLTTLGGFPAVSGQGPRQITTGPGNTLWATLDKPGDSANTKIARITGVDPPAAPTVTPGDQTPAGGDQTPAGGSMPPPDTTPPVISGLTVAKSRRSITFRFTLSEPATVKLTLSRAAAGKRRGSKCVKPTRRLRRAKRCTRLLRVKTVSGSRVAGANALRLRRPAARRYRVVLTAVDAAGNAGVAVRRSFRLSG